MTIQQSGSNDAYSELIDCNITVPDVKKKITHHIKELEKLFEDVEPAVAASNALELLDQLKVGLAIDTKH